MAWSQRGWKRQPLTGDSGLGGWPGMPAGSTRSPADVGHGAQQPDAVGVERPVVELGHGAGLGQLPGVHHDRPVAGLGDHRQVVGDEDDGQPELAAQRLQQLQDLRLDHHVEGGGRLVADDQARPAGEGHRDHHPLAHAAAELVGILPCAARG